MLLGRDRSPSGPPPQTLYGDDYFPQPVTAIDNGTKEQVFREYSFLSRLHGGDFLSSASTVTKLTN